MDRAKIIGDWRPLNSKACLGMGVQGNRPSAASDAAKKLLMVSITIQPFRHKVMDLVGLSPGQHPAARCCAAGCRNLQGVCWWWWCRADGGGRSPHPRQGSRQGYPVYDVGCWTLKANQNILLPIPYGWIYHASGIAIYLHSTLTPPKPQQTIPLLGLSFDNLRQPS